MVQSIMRDIEFLKKPSAPACPSDAPVADDLCDTLRAHIEGCVREALQTDHIAPKLEEAFQLLERMAQS